MRKRQCEWKHFSSGSCSLLVAAEELALQLAIIMPTPTRGKIRRKVTTKPEKSVAFDSLFRGKIRENENEEKRWLTTILAF